MKRALALVLLAGCQDTSGTIDLGLTTAPGSTVLDAVQRLRVTITEPHTVLETVRTDRGFDLALEVESTGGAGALIIEGFDDGDQLIASGMSPPFVVDALDARIVIYMAAPMTIQPAPVQLPSARVEAASGTLAYGAVLAGGRDPVSGAPSDAITVYNAYLHTSVEGLPMPGPRSGLGLAVGLSDAVYLFGGRDAAGTDTGTLWRFNTTVAPNGSYSELAADAGLARSDARIVQVGVEDFLITGAPVLELTASVVASRTEVPSLPAGGASVVGPDGVIAAIFAGGTGITRYRERAFEQLSATPLPGARAFGLPDHTMLVAGQATDALRVDVVTGELTAVPGFLPVACPDPDGAVTSRHVVLSCDTETFVYDALTLALVATIPSSGTSLVRLLNDQVLMLRGSELALFTPPPPP